MPGETDTGVRREIAAFLQREKIVRENFQHQARAGAAVGNESRNCRSSGSFCGASARRGRWALIFFATRRCCRRGGIPSVVFGPGDIAQAHTADEWISLASLERGKNLLLSFLKSLP